MEARLGVRAPAHGFTRLGLASSNDAAYNPCVRRGSPAAVFVVFLVALSVCAAAYAENYTYKRTTAGDATVASMILRKADFPAQFRLTGGRGKPDETGNTDSCNGYTPKERDLVVAGDAESTFHNANRSVVVDSQVAMFQTEAMAAADVQRSLRMITPACQAQAAKEEHVKLVRYALLGHPNCTCDYAVSALLETKTAHVGLDNLMIVTFIRRGRYEATLFTNIGKSTANATSAGQAAQTALIVQGTALKVLVRRVHA